MLWAFGLEMMCRAMAGPAATARAAAAPRILKFIKRSFIRLLLREKETDISIEISLPVPRSVQFIETAQRIPQPAAQIHFSVRISIGQPPVLNESGCFPGHGGRTRMAIHSQSLNPQHDSRLRFRSSNHHIPK
jgi:hypothetical protein